MSGRFLTKNDKPLETSAAEGVGGWPGLWPGPLLLLREFALEQFSFYASTDTGLSRNDPTPQAESRALQRAYDPALEILNHQQPVLPGVLTVIFLISGNSKKSRGWTFSVSSGKTFDGAFASDERRKIAASRGAGCRRCHRVSRRPIRKRRQRDSDAALEPGRLSGIHRGSIAAACHHSGHTDCFRGILAFPSAGLGNRVVEHWCGRPLNDPGLRSHEVYRRAALADRHRNFGAWFRTFFFVIAKRKRIRGIFAGARGGKSSALLASPADPYCNRSRNHLWASGQCRGIFACACLRAVPQAADQEIFCVLAGRVRRAGVARNCGSRLPRAHLLDGRGPRCSGLRAVFLSWRANCHSHEGQPARTIVRNCSHVVGCLLPLPIMNPESDGISDGARQVAQASACGF